MRASRGILVVLTALLLVAGCPQRPQPKAPVQPTPQASAPPATPVPTYDCQQILPGKIKVDGVLDEPVWKKAPAIGPFSLWDGEKATRNTKAKLLWDRKYLYAAFMCEDPDIEGTMRRRDQNLWEQNEVVEMFVDSAGSKTCYLEFEVNPRNTVLDLVIPEAHSPGPLAGKKCWDARGIKTAVKVRGTIANPKDKDKGWTVEIAIPLQDFLTAPNVRPKDGDVWHINLYRIDDTRKKIEFQAWSPTQTEKPDFHVPDRFGAVRFVALPAAATPATGGAAKAGETKATAEGKAGGKAGAAKAATEGKAGATKAGATKPPAGTKAGAKAGEGTTPAVSATEGAAAPSAAPVAPKAGAKAG
jgi:hypothetical protein